MAMLPQPSVGQMGREIQTRPPAEHQSQLPKYLLSRVCTTINVNSSPHSAAYVRRWIGSALLQIMVCRLFDTKPLSGQTFRYSQELSPRPLVYRNKRQWNFNQIIKIENFSFTEMHLNISSVKWQPFCQVCVWGGWGVGGGWGWGSSSSGAFAQVIRVAHSGVRSSCRVDLGFVVFLLIWWFLRRLFLGFLYFLQISFHSWFFHSFFWFWCILGWCVLGFLYSLCRTCTGWYFPDLFCNFLSPLSLMLGSEHCTALFSA